jgi:hypothetical protein
MGKWFPVKATIGLIVILWFASSMAVGNTGGIAAASEGQTSAQAIEIGAAAPPAVPFSVFDPNHIYLNNGTNTIILAAGSLTISGTTTAVVISDSIGITFYLQKWNGTSWETVGSGSTTGTNLTSSYSTSVVKSTTAGQYYRARTIHWVIENGKYEEGERLSNSVLAI